MKESCHTYEGVMAPKITYSGMPHILKRNSSFLKLIHCKFGGAKKQRGFKGKICILKNIQQNYILVGAKRWVYTVLELETY